MTRGRYEGHRRAGAAGLSGIPGARPSCSVAARIAAIVLAVGDSENQSLTDVARRTGLPRSTTHRLLSELVRGQLLERRDDGRYRAPQALHRRANKSQSRSQLQRAADVRVQVCNVLDDLGVATGRRARFGVWRGADISYLERPPGIAVRTCSTGLTPLSPHATALGKMLLAHAPAAQVDQVLERGLPAHTALTITTVQDLERSLAAARRAEFAVAWSEIAHGVGAAAVPVRGPDGTVVGALELALSHPTHDLPRARAGLLIAARGLGRELAARSAVLPTGTGATPLDWRADPTSLALSWGEPEVAG